MYSISVINIDTLRTAVLWRQRNSYSLCCSTRTVHKSL